MLVCQEAEVGRNGSRSDVLIDEDGISIGIQRDKTRGSGCTLVSLALKLHALRSQRTLQIANVCEGTEFTGVTVS